MKHFIIATVLAMVFGLAALAQTTPGTPQPSGTSPSAQPQTLPSQSPDMSNAGNQNPAAETKGEKKLKGCIASEGGKYVLQDKHGKNVALGGSQDFASQVGHLVTVHGTFGSGSDASSAASATSSSGGMSSAGDQFIVSKLDMVSDSCNAEKGKDKGDNYSKPNPNIK